MNDHLTYFREIPKVKKDRNKGLVPKTQWLHHCRYCHKTFKSKFRFGRVCDECKKKSKNVWRYSGLV